MKIQKQWTNELEVLNTLNEDGNPSGGEVRGIGLNIDWQNGPLGFDYVTNKPKDKPNGAFTEDVVLAVIQRLNFFQTAAEGKFRCRENAVAITKLEEALHWMQDRHNSRVERQVQGEHKA